MARDYKKEVTRTIPFTKTEFLYSCSLGSDTEAIGEKNKELLLTMELISKHPKMKFQTMVENKNLTSIG